MNEELDVYLPESADTAIPILYYLTRLIRHRRYLGRTHSLRIEGLRSEPSAEEETEAWKIAHRIEEKEGRPLQELSEKQANDYISFLSDLAERFFKRDFPYDEETGRRMLNVLRSEAQQP